MSATVTATRQGFIKTLTISNPSRKNAMSGAMARQLLALVLETRDDDSRVIILEGDGKDFCAGADLDPSSLQGGFDVAEFLRSTYNPLVQAIRDMDKIFIAKVRGVAVGVGFNFALACDLVYAAETARFSQIFTQIGLSTDGGGAYFMLERMGYHRALELMLTHRMISGAEAGQWGIINQACPDEELDEIVEKMAALIAHGPFTALRNTKANVRAAARGGLAAAVEQEAVSQGENFRTKDFFEGVAAFLHKRKPTFKGE